MKIRLFCYALAAVFFVLFATLASAQTPPQPPFPIPPTPSIRNVILNPWPSLKVNDGEVSTFTIDGETSTGDRLTNLAGLVIPEVISENGVKVELNCQMTIGVCAIRGTGLGTATIQIWNASHSFGLRPLAVNFVKKQSHTIGSVDSLLVTSSSSQAATGETFTSSVYFDRSYDGPHFLIARIYGQIAAQIYFHDGIKQGQRVTLLNRAVTRNEDSFFLDVMLRAVGPDRDELVGLGGTFMNVRSSWKSVDAVYDQFTQSITIKSPKVGDTAEVRLMISRGEFFEELPFRRYDTGAFTELVYLNGMMRQPYQLPRGRYTIAVVVKERSFYYEYSEVNGLYLDSDMK